jgi:hypothetical protein
METHGRELRYYRWYYKHIFSRCYDPGIIFFLSHFGGENYFVCQSMPGRFVQYCFGAAPVACEVNL